MNPKTRNGPNGISLLIVSFFVLNAKRIKLTAAPIQNARTTAEIPSIRPRAQPMPRANLPSPSPIHLPLEKNQRRKKGKNKAGPATNTHKVAGPKKKICSSAIIEKPYTKPSGMIWWR